MESHHHVQQRSDASLLHTFVAREKPGADNPARYIVGGSIAGAIVIVVLAVATWFHLRRRKADRLEKHRDLQELDDYGLGDGRMTRGDDDVNWPSRGQSMAKNGGGSGGRSG